MMMFWLLRRLQSFFSTPEAGPLVLAAVVTACMGSALGFFWVPWASALCLALLVLTSDDDDPQHPVLA